MSKRNKTPKTPEYRQGDLFADQSEATDKEADGISRGIRRAELLSRLEAQRTLTAGIMNRIADLKSLVEAFQRVKRNKGGSGVDGVTTEEYERNFPQHIRELQSQLLSGI